MTVEQTIGAALMSLFLTDVFLTVLYARAGTGLLAPYWSRASWRLFFAASKLSGRYSETVLSLAGPMIVVLLIGFWSLGLTVGAALVIRPELGISIRSSSSGTPTDFVTALLVAGNTLSIVGSGGDYSPHSTSARILFLMNSLIGASVLSLVLSYLVQVYAGLRERNTLALIVHLMTNSTGDAAEMLARLAPNGDYSNATSELGNLARSVVAVKEAHHFYPLLFYFRFTDPLYAVSRFSFVLIDLMTLIETALDRRQCVSLMRSAPVTSLRQCTMLLLETLDRNFATAGTEEAGKAEKWRYRQSYSAAIDILAAAGLATRSDGVDHYVAERRGWEPLVQRVAPTLGYVMDEIDMRRPAGQTGTLSIEG